MSNPLPANLLFSKDHEWVRPEDDHHIVIGITAHAVDQLGDITLVTLPETGTEIETGNSFGDIDSVKAVSELFAPVDGEVVETNSALQETPEIVNEDPYNKGWMIRVKLKDSSQLSNLLKAEQYQSLLDKLADE